MNRKNLPLLLMLAAGAVTCIITFIEQYSMLQKLVALFVVLLVFYLIGSMFKWLLDFFDAQNEKRRAQEGEVIEKEAESQDGIQEEEGEEEVPQESEAE